MGGDLKVHSWRRRVSLITLGISSNNQRMLVPPASSCAALKCCFVLSVSRNFQGSEVLSIVCVDWLKSGKTSLEHKTEFKTKEFFSVYARVLKTSIKRNIDASRSTATTFSFS